MDGAQGHREFQKKRLGKHLLDWVLLRALGLLLEQWVGGYQSSGSHRGEGDAKRNVAEKGQSEKCNFTEARYRGDVHLIEDGIALLPSARGLLCS